jgi:hypothetical protein
MDFLFPFFLREYILKDPLSPSTLSEF